ncbi:glycosyltransferase family 17 protein [Neurospora crassa]|uniref:Glycosyltransferase family 17 protein n=1 Tax=Neurospora crassa (strain ATCC 24698 / 74-OR23-1A / CBS 708.71 / DSM 1257 / FGSC 987) TaxID=367110 RepID=Q7SF00_NEUCR|nr:hypothetical protein NCU07455 [Neurospora crassa OR74A]EAA35406.2 hypothetical protein NCU07455 [Neurospora crassa OR74A]KHE80731.1 glycosyltransferase family 17 protein [Neurospora crassa]|eukprot:XP_964642.2 hypothetical protein NCU07455 [Neurospora crassa OR74A]
MLLQPITNPSKCTRYIVVLLSIWAFIYLFSPFNLRLDKNNHGHDDAEANKGSSLSQHDICRPYGWKPYQPRQPSDPPRKIYDLVLVTTELDLLEVRLNTTWDAVDYYVLVESAKTFTGQNKPLLLQHALDSSSRFDSYKSKIIYHEVEHPEDSNPPPSPATRRASVSASGSGSGSVPSSPWEDFHLNAMFDQVFPSLAADETEPPTNPSLNSSLSSSSSSIPSPRSPQQNDILLLSLASEIPRPQTLGLLKECTFPARLTLSSKMHYYSFQFVRRPSWFSRTHEYGPGYVDQESKKVEWGHPQATVYKGVHVGGKTVMKMSDLRYGLSTSGSGVDVFTGSSSESKSKSKSKSQKWWWWWWTTAKEWMLDKGGENFWLGLLAKWWLWLWDDGRQGQQEQQTLQNASWTCQFCFPTLSEFLLMNDEVDGIDRRRRHRLGAGGPFGEIDEMERDRIVRYVREGKDLWADIHERQGERKKWVFEDVVNNTDVPSFLLESPEGKEGGRLRFLMERGGRSGGFRDYHEVSRVGVKDRGGREEAQEKVMGK